MIRILIIDDDSAIHLITSAALQRSGGFHVSFARTGRQGIHCARATRPDLILLDLMLPDLDGDEVLVELRRHEELREVPVLFVTAKQNHYAVDPDRSGAQGVVVKPFDPEQLAGRIRQVLGLQEDEAADGTARASGGMPLPAGGSIERLRTGFISRGVKEVQRLERMLDGTFDVDAARRLAHLWIGRGGTLGYPAVSEAARRLETLLSLPTKLDPRAVGKALSTVEAAFTAAQVEQQAAVAEIVEDNRCRHASTVAQVPEEMRDALRDRSVWIIGLSSADAADVEDALSAAGAGPFARARRPEDLRASVDTDLVILDLEGQRITGRQRMGHAIAAGGTPVLLIGDKPELLERDSAVLTQLVLRPWSDEELLLRSYQLVTEADSRAGAALVGSAETHDETTIEDHARDTAADPAASLAEPTDSEPIVVQTTEPMPIQAQSEVEVASARDGAPVAQDSATQEPVPLGSEAGEGRSTPSDGAQVVIADDDPTISALVEATLASIGVRCLVATGGDDALELIREHRPDAAILDVNMPQRDGFEVLAALRRDPASATLPVIMLTALRQETEVVRGFRLGADDYVVKPFNPMELSVRLERLLGAARSARRRQCAEAA